VSLRYMAKACAYLCRQCCCIDGFGEFGDDIFPWLPFLLFCVLTRLLHQLHLLSSLSSSLQLNLKYQRF